MKNYWIKKFIYTNASGKILTKNEYIKSYISSTDFKWELQELEEMEIIIHDNTAIIICKIHDVFSYKYEKYDTQFLSTQVFIKTNIGWKYFSGHTSNL